jgi:Flp pilus assembly CpaF family ATPase
MDMFEQSSGAEDAFQRIEDLLGEVVMRIPHRSIATAIGAIVEITKDRDGKRRVSRIVGDVRYEGGTYQFRDLMN